ncbi:MAG: stage II sporulation protein D [Christensenellales bacterium]
MNYIKVCHKFEIINNKKEFVVYADYPFEYEFGLDFDRYKEKVKEVTSEIKKYVKSHLESVKDATAILVLNGVIIGTFAISQIIGPNVSNTNTNTNTKETNLVAKVADEGENIVADSSISEGEILDTDADKIEEGNKKVDNLLVNVSDSNVSAVKVESLDSKSNYLENTNTISNVNNTLNSNMPIEEVRQEKTVNVKLNNGKIINITLEEYVIGVVGSEMPALFNEEALKAQSIAARTYALKKDSVGATLVASTSDQVYKTNSELKSMWGESFNTYYEKVKKAVMATKGEVMMYNGKYIDALYFSTSNGRTEDPIYVWNYSAPYLKSVDSKWDIGTKFFNATKTIPISELNQKLGVNINSVNDIQIKSQTTGGRVNSIIIGGKEFTGVNVRMLLGLRSSDFTVSENGSNIVFTTKGWGHGVGMSQYGANEMAKAGYNYSQILKHYYTGITIVKK